MNDSGRITAKLACLADPSRYRVLSVLVAGDYCVTEIAARVGLSQSCTTRHLQILQRVGVLTRTRAGKRVLFRIREGDPELDRMLELVVMRRPLETAPVPRTAPRTRDRDPARSDWVPTAHRSRSAAAGGSRENAITIPASAGVEPPADAPRAADSPSEPEEPAVPAAESNPPVVAVELEDYLL